MNLTAQVIATITSSATITCGRYAAPLVTAMEHFDINNPRRVAAFLAQVAHESGHFQRTEELMGYSAKRMTEVWPTRFKTIEEAKPFAYNPEALANRVYSGRLGNGNEASGDGWRYRGRGLIQITGKSNYAAAEDALGMSITGDNSFRVAAPDGAAWTACWFWYSRKCNGLADAWDLEKLSKTINGGLIGFEDGDDKGLNDRVELCSYAWTQVRTLGKLLFNDL